MLLPVFRLEPLPLPLPPGRSLSRTVWLWVEARAELMEKAYPQGYGLAAVIGLSETHLSEIISAINKPESPVFLGNLNAPTQFVIAGSDSGMEGVLNRAKDEGARTAKRLHVSVPSHCVLLKSVADELTRLIANIEIKTPKAIYVSNRRARALRDPDGIREDLATNIAHPVRWHDATDSCLRARHPFFS